MKEHLLQTMYTLTHQHGSGWQGFLEEDFPWKNRGGFHSTPLPL